MGCDRYEVGIRDRETGRMMNKSWTPQELERNTPWLKRLNAQGNDIYVRPAKDASRQDLVLVDDLKKADLQRMYADGIRPAVVVETSPQNHQAWVKLPQPATDAERREVARELARTYGGDPQSADARHYGRLGGFTNQKPQYVDELGKRPYCLVRESSGQVAERGGQQLGQARERVADQVHQVDLSKRVEGIREAGQTRWGGSSPVATYQREAGKLASQIEKAGQKVDWSRVDFSVTAKMAKSGDFTADQIKKAIQVASPGVTSRHQGAVADYAARTLQKVIESVPGASQALSLALQATKRAMTLER
jgi:hypothetical protein